MSSVVVIDPETLSHIVAEAVRDGIRQANALCKPPEFVSPSQFAHRMGWSRSTVHAKILAGLPTIGRGKARRIEVATALAWLNAQPRLHPRDYRPADNDTDDAATAAAKRVAGRTRST